MSARASPHPWDEHLRGAFASHLGQHDAVVRIAVDLPLAVHRRAQELATDTGRPLSAVIVDLAARGLAQLDGSAAFATAPRTGFPVITVGRRVTAEQVAAASDEE